MKGLGQVSPGPGSRLGQFLLDVVEFPNGAGNFQVHGTQLSNDKTKFGDCNAPSG